jgi:hypothetical protein
MEGLAVGTVQRRTRNRRYPSLLRGADNDDSAVPTLGRRSAVRLEILAETWQRAEVPEEMSDVLHAVYERIVVAGPEFVGVRLTPAAYAHGLALALPEKVAMTRPTVSESTT